MVHNINEDLHVTGKLVIKKADGTKIIEIGSGSNLFAGGGGWDGDLILRDGNGKHLVHLGAEEKELVFKKADGSTILYLGAKHGNIRAGGHGADGDLLLFPSTASDIFNNAQATIHLDADDQKLLIKKTDGNTILHLGAKHGNIRAGGHGADGDLLLFPSTASDIFNNAQATIHLDADAGDIILKNADCAEEFDVAVAEAVEPGSVMVINEGGGIKQSTEAYDKKVAGVVSGAGNLKPGLVLDKKDEAANRLPLALMGKAYCKVDAQYAPIEVGDLLTTSPTPGHAMKASDPAKAFGTVIGKALQSLAKGQDSILILIALQ